VNGIRNGLDAVQAFGNRITQSIEQCCPVDMQNDRDNELNFENTISPEVVEQLNTINHDVLPVGFAQYIDWRCCPNTGYHIRHELINDFDAERIRYEQNQNRLNP